MEICCHRVVNTLILVFFVAGPLTLADLPMLQTRLDSVSGLWYPLGMELKVDTNILGGIPRVAS